MPGQLQMHTSITSSATIPRSLGGAAGIATLLALLCWHGHLHVMESEQPPWSIAYAHANYMYITPRRKLCNKILTVFVQKFVFKSRIEFQTFKIESEFNFISISFDRQKQGCHWNCALSTRTRLQTRSPLY